MRFLGWMLLIMLAAAPVLQARQAVYVVLFTHIEDNTPSGDLGTVTTRNQYLNLRGKLIAMSELARRYQVPWSLQPDWRILLAALHYEDVQLAADTNGKNFLRYLKEDLGVIIDPHSHESFGYNYTDVVHLLQQLEVGGSTVIGGHIWDPALPQFSNWERFRVPVAGLRYPTTLWRGDILMGSGTPNHVNDPVVTGVWRPQDRNHYFVDDPNGNIALIGDYKKDLAGIDELIEMYRIGKVATTKILTGSYHIRPVTITGVGGLLQIEQTVLQPLVERRGRGELILTDFSALVETWRTQFHGVAHIYDANNPPPDDGSSRFEAMQWFPEGSFQFELHSAPGLHLSVETSSNLVQWSPWVELTNETGRVTLQDTRAAGGSPRIYRARRLDE